MTTQPKQANEHVVNYAIVALIGMLAGILVGALFASGKTETVSTKGLPLARPRGLTSNPP